MLALAEAITKGYTVTPHVWECDMCGWHHFGAVRSVPKRCESTRKIPYPTEADAQKALSVMIDLATAGNVRRAEKNIYHCRFCDQWHTTSMDRRENDAT